MGKTIKTFFIENDLNSFKDYHDKKWFKDTSELVNGTKIKCVFDDFAPHWYGSARAFILPWLLIDGVFESIKGDKASRQDIWNGYLERMEFKVGLWKLAESMFCATYYAYENLVVSCLKEIKGASIRVT